MHTVRPVIASDLQALLALYRHLNPEMPELAPEIVARIWQETLAQPGLTVFIAPAGDHIAAACTLITAPNLMRGGAPYAFLENVVTHTDHRRQGYGRAVVAATFVDRAECNEFSLVRAPSSHRSRTGRGAVETLGSGGR